MKEFYYRTQTASEKPMLFHLGTNYGNTAALHVAQIFNICSPWSSNLTPFHGHCASEINHTHYFTTMLIIAQHLLYHIYPIIRRGFSSGSSFEKYRIVFRPHIGWSQHLSTLCNLWDKVFDYKNSIFASLLQQNYTFWRCSMWCSTETVPFCNTQVYIQKQLNYSDSWAKKSRWLLPDMFF